MASIVIKKLAQVTGIPVQALLLKLQCAGVDVSEPEEEITDKEKLQLLEYIRSGNSVNIPTQKNSVEKCATKRVHKKDNIIKVDFGVVKKYFTDKGFGFITHTFLDDHQPEVFFHIKSIKHTRHDLVEKLVNKEPLNTIYFWYQTENTNKGEQVYKVLKSDLIREIVTDTLPIYADKIESIWSNVDYALPVWLRDVTVDLVGIDRANELSLKREFKEREKRENEEERQKKQEALRRIEEEKLQKQIEEKIIYEEIKAKEFEQLVAEIKSLGFTRSNQVSWYIRENRLGNKYKNISGIVKMQKDGDLWSFEGGFPSDIYARLCRELELNNQGSYARVVGFKPYKDL